MTTGADGFPLLTRAEIAGRVAEVLGVDPSAIDQDGDLIAQGLDSVRMMSLAGRWRRDGHDVDFARLVAAPSIRDWVHLLAGAGRAESPESNREAAEGEPFALAPMQHAMWIGRQPQQPLGGVAGHLYVEFDGGAVDPDRLRDAATRLAVRHPMLRVEFLPDGRQRISAPLPEFPLAVNDFQALAADEVETRLAAIRRGKSHQQLDGQVFELTLSLLPGQRTRLHVDLDMQAADAMSYRTLMNDLALLYGGATLPALGCTYQQYRQKDSQPRAADADRTWWRARLDDLPDAPALPLVPVGQQSNPHRTERRWHWLVPEIRDGLFEQSRRHGVTPAMALAASFADAVAGWSTDPRFLLNVPMFGRQPVHPDIDNVVGDFTSSLLLDVDLAAATTATRRALALQRALHESAAHASYPGLSVLRDLTRHRGAQALAPVVFTSALSLGELFSPEVTAQFGAAVWIISQGPQVLLDAQVTELDGGILLNWDVREEAFRPGVIDAMFDRHIDEVRALAVDADTWDVGRSPLLPVAQRATRESVNSRITEPSGKMLHDGFFEIAARQPDAPAMFSGTRTVTYGQLRSQALAVSAALAAAGVRAGGTVAVLGPKGAEQVPALLGIHAAGCAYLPIGADQPAERAQRILAGGDVDLVLVCGGGSTPDVAVPALRVADALARGAAGNVTVCSGDPTRLAYVLFTSGSTGEPKGVEVTHDAAMNTVEFITEHFDLGPDDRCLSVSTLECDISVLDIFATLGTGGAIVMIDEEDRRNPDHWVRLIEMYGVTVLHFLPGWLAMLLEVAGPLPTVRAVPTGGDWVTPAMARLLRDRAPRARFAGLGGATETAIHNTICEVGEVPADWTAIPFGKPLPNNRCRIVGQSGQDCPDWVVGELWIGGRGVARGYRGRPELTAERFVRYDGLTWYRTGDLARFWPDGTCEFVGRADDRVKISGYRVELGEVEAALARIPGVRAAVAAAIPSGAGSPIRLGAAVQVDGGQWQPGRLRAALANELPQHMVPHHLELVASIPFTLGGKVDRHAVARLLTVSADTGTAYRAPSDPLQSALVQIIVDVLDRTRIGVDDDFFARGGDSVLATTVVARIRQWLDVPSVSVADIFAGRTVAAIADRLCAIDSPHRLHEVAAVYLDVAAMDTTQVAAALAG